VRRLAATAAAIAAAAVVLAAGCAGDDGSPGPDDVGDPPPTGAEVRIVDNAYEPAEVTVTGGDLVVFTNEGATDHTVTGDGLDSGAQRPGESFRYVTDAVEETTTIEVHCSIHPRMEGTITVEPGGS
jgi:plastocyanin